jgi:sugar phosphate isomerase/epimerase
MSISRRDWFSAVPVSVSASLIAQEAAPAADKTADDHFRLCLNTSTISGQKLTLVEEIEIASRAGFQAIEPWIRELDEYVKKGGNLKDLGKRIKDAGLTVESAIGFFEWIVDDDERRKKALEEARRSLDIVQQIGGKRLAAPPVGATKQADLNLHKAAERYRALLDIGEKIGVVPQVELWGFSQTLGKLGDCALVALESGHPQACILVDVYHLYKGGSNFGMLKLLSGSALQVIHFNDYPDKPPRAEITDAMRVYPGDGVAPLKTMLRDLRSIGFKGTLSLELFNRDYWQKDALAVSSTGLEKMRAVVKSSMQ